MRPTLLLALAIASLLLLGACTSASAMRAEEPKPTADAEASTESEDDDERSVLTSVLMWFPNRVLDIGDVVWAGVDVGPGVGIQAQATEVAELAALSRISVGVGFQGFRHLPVKAGAEAAGALGPIGGGTTAGIGWKNSPSALRLELHPLLAGAHIGFDPLELVDAVLGLLFIDVLDDDL